MNHRNLQTNIADAITGIVAVWLVLLPFHAFVTVWASTAVGHYTALRLWKEILLLGALVGVGYLLWKRGALRRSLASSWLARIALAYAVVTLMWGIVAYLRHGVTERALLYGLLVNLRPLLIVLVAWVAAKCVGWLYQYWVKLVLYPAVVVMGIGLLQRFVLPYDVLRHFGYTMQTIPPYETIDHKVSYIRVRSTLRGANLLGGYLLLVGSVVAQRLLVARRQWQWLLTAAVLLVVLFASGSRGAWLGAVAALAVLAMLQLQTQRARRLAVVTGLVLVLLLSGGLILLRDNDFVQNTFFHTDEHSRSSVSSNDAHLEATLSAATQVIHEPLGRGPGTAGPAAVYNPGYADRLAENYFVQIGQEVGWLGLALFVAMYGMVAASLWRRRQTVIAQVSLASLAGLTVMALLMHIWTDDTIVYVWGSLAGIALAQQPLIGWRDEAAHKTH